MVIETAWRSIWFTVRCGVQALLITSEQEAEDQAGTRVRNDFPRPPLVIGTSAAGLHTQCFSVSLNCINSWGPGIQMVGLWETFPFKPEYPSVLIPHKVVLVPWLQHGGIDLQHL